MKIKFKRIGNRALFVKVLFSFLFLFIAFQSYSQYSVRNNKNGELIPYVAVSDLARKWGTYTDEKGYFFIPENLTIETIELRRLGFEAIEVKLDTLSSVIYINESPIALQEVVINPKFISYKPITLKASKRKRSINSIALYGGELVTQFKKPERLSNLREVRFRIRPVNSQNHPRLRIKVYTSNHTTLANRAKSVYDTLFIVPNMTRNLSLDFTFKPLFIQNDYVFVGIEWLTNAENSGFTEPQLFYAESISKKNVALFSQWGSRWNTLEKLTKAKDSVPIMYVTFQ